MHLQKSRQENWSDSTHSRQDGPDSPIEHLLLETHTKLTQICASESLSDQIALAAWPSNKPWQKPSPKLHSCCIQTNSPSRQLLGIHIPPAQNVLKAKVYFQLDVKSISSKEWKWGPAGCVKCQMLAGDLNGSFEIWLFSFYNSFEMVWFWFCIYVTVLWKFTRVHW